MARSATTSTQRRARQDLKGFQPVGRGRDNRVFRTSHGQHIIFPPNEDWWHPWHINAGWDYNLEQWCVWVTPGFVNGYPPVIPVQEMSIKRKVVPEFPDRKVDRGTNPLDGQPYYSAWIFNKPKNQQTQEEQSAAKSGRTRDVYITDEMEPFLQADSWFDPLSPMVTQNVDGNPTAHIGSYPKFFQLVSVKDPRPTTNFDVPFGGATVTSSFSDDQREKGNRELRSCDLILVAEHSAIKADVLQTDPATGSFTYISNAFTSGNTRFPFRLIMRDRFVGPPAYPSIEDKLNGNLTEPTTDELLLARLWMVSPPDAGEDSEPDETWEPFYQHFVFWNLGYAQPNYIPSQVAYNPITINIPLGGGFLTLLANQLLAPLNDADQAILNALNQSSSKGYFYTAP